MDEVGNDDRIVQRPAPAIDAGPVGLEGDDRITGERAARSAIGLRHLGSEQPERARLRPDLAIDLSFLFPALVMRLALGLEEPARLVRQHVEFLGHPGWFWQTEDRHWRPASPIGL